MTLTGRTTTIYLCSECDKGGYSSWQWAAKHLTNKHDGYGQMYKDQVRRYGKQCNGIVFNDSPNAMFRERPCDRKANERINNVWFCWQHAKLETKSAC